MWLNLDRKQLLFGMAIVSTLIVVGQFIFPSSYLLPFTKVDDINFNTVKKEDAVRELNAKYQSAKVAVYFGKAEQAYRSPSVNDLKVTIDNTARIDQMNYPWYLRIVPSSFLWAHVFVKPTQDPRYVYNKKAIEMYVDKELGSSCSVEPANASFKFNGDKLELVKAHDGGTCEVYTVTQKLSLFKVNVTGLSRITIPVKVSSPEIKDTEVRELLAKLNNKLSDGVAIITGSSTKIIPAAEIFKWIDPIELEGKIGYSFNGDRASGYLSQQIAPSVTVKPGISKVTTQDFTEISRQDGSSGQALDIAGTLNQLKEYVDTKRVSVAAVTRSVAPTVEYTRSYSPTDAGLSALLKNYAESHSGTFGISLIELSDKRRRASYQEDKQFTTASTYKLFVAYSTLKRVEEGKWQWSDQIQGNRNLEKCFDDMIVRSDNACAEALLSKITFKAATSEIQALGLKNTTFLKGDTPLTTAGDLSMFNAMLQSNQLLSQQSSRDRLIGAMKRNIYRQGIPAGTGSQVADKVGFLEGLFHDAAIVYGPNGPYILTIMTDGSNWATIADLTRQIETLRNQ